MDLVQDSHRSPFPKGRLDQTHTRRESDGLAFLSLSFANRRRPSTTLTSSRKFAQNPHHCMQRSTHQSACRSVSRYMGSVARAQGSLPAWTLGREVVYLFTCENAWKGRFCTRVPFDVSHARNFPSLAAASSYESVVEAPQARHLHLDPLANRILTA